MLFVVLEVRAFVQANRSWGGVHPNPPNRMGRPVRLSANCCIGHADCLSVVHLIGLGQPSSAHSLSNRMSDHTSFWQTQLLHNEQFHPNSIDDLKPIKDNNIISCIIQSPPLLETAACPAMLRLFSLVRLC